MMRLPGFEYLAPTSLSDACRALADDPGGTRVVAGGTDLWPNMKRRHQQARRVVALRRVSGMRGVQHGSGECRLGAMTTLSDILRDEGLRSAVPGFVQAVGSISTPVLRNMGTIGGNLALDTRCTYYDQSEEWRRAIGYCMKEAGETCWVRPTGKDCLAVSSTDAAPVLCALGARVVLESVDGERDLPLPELYANDGIDYLRKEPHEIIREVIVPTREGVRSTYWKLRRRGSIDFPVLGVGVAYREATGGEPRFLRIFLGGLESAPVPAQEAERHLAEGPLDEERIAGAARLAREHARSYDNTDFEPGWRLLLVERYVEGALRQVLGLPEKTRAPGHGSFYLEV